MHSNITRSHQRGAILVVSLLLLLVMTVLGVAAMHVTNMEERMAGNVRDVNLAFQGAEAGLRDAEDRIRLMTTRPDTCSTAPCAVWQRNVPPSNLRDQPQTWWNANSTEYGVAGVQEITYTMREPQAVTEEYGFLPDSLTVGHGPPEGRNYYRMTSHSNGGTEPAQAVLESTYARRF
jgi:type IV pilus assembly protein PilX